MARIRDSFFVLDKKQKRFVDVGEGSDNSRTLSREMVQ